ncbi:MAG TPA: thiamine pyrophosphate-dependent dehydrogenase E1 component subunit alpha [Nitrospira sp.]|nr:thiamine pyrophosphate-dependent dehydrogenase E1 component subunit alpha [Nitrospira sp.]MCW5793373.1 thiamine pyrophosphate-dependent dehydrogenase E1 component subunit alpha [Nitrospira sp.]HMU30826.1 thiamine pyrophosphate-dependent dehydrogenase E1 component subunit alpha [Nitrospira sp.]HMW84367.1 thiamine pyrophosphate-dependent dehydrogenase E1 component subunit alpha [Nitrospira sp.]HMX92481.1 thiamine pyrophosphate-dependent dehydrogenase E1 component subunit alpha [Nitrospira sp.]
MNFPDVHTGALSRDQLISLLRAMQRIRMAEERIGELVETREVRTPCHLSIGQEAIPAGVCAALQQDDTLWGGHRSHGHYLAKGGDLRGMMAEIFGKATGCARGRGGSMHLVDPAQGIFGTVPLVAATIPLAVGAALSAKLRGTQQVAVAFFGDGATDEGHFHESLNLAALYRLPVLFVCENNLYSTHLTLKERRVKDNIVESAALHGLPGVVVDGNDATAVYQTAHQAVQRARIGEGPTLLECRTYRWRGHVGPAADLEVGTDRRRELDDWQRRDPIAQCRGLLKVHGLSSEVFDRLEAEIRREIDEAVSFARLSPAPDESELLQHVYARGGV